MYPIPIECRGFVYAEELEKGDFLVTDAGSCVKVESVEADEGVTADSPVMAYNFEVEDWHTYFVGEGCVLVHNKSASCSGGNKQKEEVVNKNDYVK